MRFMKKNKHTNAYFISGAAITVLFIILMLIGLIHTPYDPNAMNGAEKFSSPSFSHIMGTDNFGRDIFSRVLKGISMTGLVAVSTVAIGGSIGTITGAVTGYYGGLVDEIVMRINDALNGFPSILIALIIVSIIGPGKYNVILALGILFIPSFARIVRSEYISLKERDFVKSARLMGAGNMRIIFRHIFPNIRSTLFVTATIAAGCEPWKHAVGCAELSVHGSVVCYYAGNDHSSLCAGIFAACGGYTHRG